jgi:hypothetical protein
MTERAGPPASLAPEQAEPASAERLGRTVSRGIVLRLAAHLAAWVPFVIGAIRSAQQGSVVIGDGAAIALRSWDVLTPYGPLVGQATQLRNGAFDAGPLQYWLLAIPVHLDPRDGVVWGAALWCMMAASLAIGAARSAAGTFGALAAAGVILGCVVWQPLVAAQPYWNPWLGLLFFLAALAAGLAVVSGRRRWWPVLVITASVAAQAHLMFALASAVLVLLALVTGLTDTIRARGGYGWAPLGLAAGAACWVAPFIQQFTGRHGNLAMLIDSVGQQQTAGPGFGLKALTAAAWPAPVWWTPTLAFRHTGIGAVFGARSAAFGVTMLAVTAVVLVVAVRPLRSRRLAALAAVSLLASGATLATYSGIPAENIANSGQNYLLIVLLPVGLVAWLAVGAAVALAARRLTGPGRVLAAVRRRIRSQLRAGPGLAGGAGARWAVRALGAAAVALVALESWLGVAQQALASEEATSAQQVSTARYAAQYIEQLLPRQRLELSVVTASGVYQRQVTLGVAWALRADGFAPAVNHRAARYLGPRYLFAGLPMPDLTVVVRNRGLTIRFNQGGTTEVP